jgi:26S proteasome regulatory subunit N3
MDKVLTRQLVLTRHRIRVNELVESTKSHCSADLHRTIEAKCSSLDQSMDDTKDVVSMVPAGLKPNTPEADIYLGLLATVLLIDKRKAEDALEIIMQLVKRVKPEHTLDHLGSKVYFYYVRVHELLGRIGETLPVILSAHRSAVVHHATYRQAVLINLILRGYFVCGLMDQAQQFASLAPFPETRSNAEYARYLYYMGIIRAIELRYSDSHTYLMQASRKAPPTGAHGFRIAITKAGVIVELLMGDIPERSRFNQFKTPLAPYLAITEAVRAGDVAGFSGIIKANEQGFTSDRLLSLIHRLHQNVIKAGLRTITNCYSRITLENIAKKLSLASVQEAADVTAKTIMDGIIDARINYETGVVESAWGSDVYSTTDPRDQLNKRIAFCMQLHTDAVRAMQYPDVNEMEKELLATNEEILRAQKIDLEEALAEHEDDDDMMM